MAVHEMGHIVGAFLTGGHIERVVLHPFTISRTDVSPNPSPVVVVWLGPIFGSVLPLAVSLFLPQGLTTTRKMVMFFAGFCLIANGAYIALGSFDKIGDSGVMLRHGSPMWMLLAFGLLTIPLGLFVWHRLGSVRHFLFEPSTIDARTTYVTVALLVIVYTLGVAFFPC